MTINMGTVDRIVRLSIVALIIILFLMGKLSGTVAIVLGIVAIAFFLTSLIGWCPTYALLGISTKKK